MGYKEDLQERGLKAGLEHDDMKNITIKELEKLVKDSEELKQKEIDDAAKADTTKETVVQGTSAKDNNVINADIVIPKQSNIKNVNVRVVKDFPDLYIFGEKYHGSAKTNIVVPENVAERLRESGYVQ